jgi:hypothetical protein
MSEEDDGPPPVDGDASRGVQKHKNIILEG